MGVGAKLSIMQVTCSDLCPGEDASPHLAPAHPSQCLRAPRRPGLLLLPPVGFPRDRRHCECGALAVAPQRPGREDPDELRFRLLEQAGLSESERNTAMLLLAEDCGSGGHPASGAGPTTTGGAVPAP